MRYGQAATNLIRSLKRECVDIIPPYEYSLVEQVNQELEELYVENLRLSQSTNEPQEAEDQKDDIVPTETKASNHKMKETPEIDENDLRAMQTRHTVKLWNKRCMVAYHYERLKRVKHLRWKCGNNLPNELVKNLSLGELEWFTEYNDNLFNYMSVLNGGLGLDLTLYMKPPKKLYIQVKCLRDYGLFEQSNGQTVVLKKDSIHYLPLKECEKLISLGVLEQTSL